MPSAPASACTLTDQRALDEAGWRHCRRCLRPFVFGDLVFDRMYHVDCPPLTTRELALDEAVRREGNLLAWCRKMLRRYGIAPTMIDVRRLPEYVAGIRAEYRRLTTTAQD